MGKIKGRLKSKKTTRVTVDFPLNRHKRLKALAALKGVSLQEFVRSCVDEKIHEQLDEKNLDDQQFRKLLKEITEEDEDILKRLAGQ